MGNCMDVLCCSAEKSIVFIQNGGQIKCKPSTRVEKVTRGRYSGYVLVHNALPYAPLPPNTRLEPGEVYYLMPPLLNQPVVSSKLDAQQTCTARRKVKVVLTRQQLVLLLGNSQEFKAKGINLKSSEKFTGGDRKWQPSLVTIPEGQKF